MFPLDVGKSAMFLPSDMENFPIRPSVNERTTDFPSHVETLAKVKPVYRTLPGWKTDITGVRKLEDLPAATRTYVDTLAELVGSPVQIISVGPDRRQTIFCD